MVQAALEMLLREFVEKGDIEIADRSLDQIFEDCDEILQGFIAEGVSLDFHASIDYRGSLLDRARAEAEAKHYDFGSDSICYMV